MNNLFGIFILLLLLGCNTEDGWDCTKTAGKIMQQEVDVPLFTKITVWDRTRLVIEQGTEQKVVVESGSNLINDVSISVFEGRLEIRDANTCNLFRDYGITKIYVTSPNIEEIRSSSGYEIESRGILRFPELSLVSEDFNAPGEYHSDGDFRLELDVENLKVVANGLSKFYLSGKATQANFGLYASDGRIYSENLVVQNLEIFHRSSGPMVVNPQQSIKGKIMSLGNVISKNRPPEVDVEELYSGRLIFE